MKPWIAEILCLFGTFAPRLCERAKKILIRIAGPQARLRREPIQFAQPLRSGFKARIVQNPNAWDRFIARVRNTVIGWLQPA